MPFCSASCDVSAFGCILTFLATLDADQFKDAFLKAQKENEEIFGKAEDKAEGETTEAPAA